MLIFDEFELGPLGFSSLALGSAIVTGLVCVLLARPARRIGLVSRRRRDRFGSGRVPLTAGAGLVAGMTAALLALGLGLPPGWMLLAGGLFLVGLVDDLRPLRPPSKFTLQSIVTVAALALLGVGWSHAALCFLLVLVLVNACNYLDNMDGLLAGVALTQAITLLLFDTQPGRAALLLVWTLPAVLCFTAPPARIYLGDSGSHLIGALFALDAIDLLVVDGAVRGGRILPIALLFAIPLADVAAVTASRLKRRRPVFRGGTDHLSHRLVRLGWSVPRAVLLLVLASAVCGVASLFLVHS